MPFNLQEKKQINFMDIQSNIIYGSTTTIYIYRLYVAYFLSQRFSRSLFFFDLFDLIHCKRGKYEAGFVSGIWILNFCI